MEHQRAEPVRMGVGVAQMQNHRAEKVVLAYTRDETRRYSSCIVVLTFRI